MRKIQFLPSLTGCISRIIVRFEHSQRACLSFVPRPFPHLLSSPSPSLSSRSSFRFLAVILRFLDVLLYYPMRLLVQLCLLSIYNRLYIQTNNYQHNTIRFINCLLIRYNNMNIITFLRTNNNDIKNLYPFIRTMYNYGIINDYSYRDINKYIRILSRLYIYNNVYKYSIKRINSNIKRINSI